MFIQADTIIYDAQKIAEYQADKRYDYDSQLDLPEYSWFDIVAEWFNRLLNTIFSGSFEKNVTTPVMITIFVTALIMVIYFLYKKRPELFMFSKKNTPLPYDIEEVNIHGIDFDKEISSALNSGDYRLAIRFTYLQTLRFLSDNQQIEWQIHKTPTEYLYEVKNKNVKPPFRDLTNKFLLVRYGNYSASYELYEIMLNIQTQIKDIQKGGLDER